MPEKAVGQSCGECGFDSARWRVRDAHTVFEAAGMWWRLALAGLTPDEATRPAETGKTAIGYARVATEAIATHRATIETLLATDLPGNPETQHRPGIETTGEQVAALEAEGLAMAKLTSMRHAAWSRQGDGGSPTAQDLLMEAVHETTHAMMDAARVLADLGLGTPAAKGIVAQVSVSGGGVPKQPVDRAQVSFSGLEGDRQADKRHHGRPFQALCLWSGEVIDELAGLGHPIGPGCAGENITVRGIDWASLRPGSRLRIGGVLAEISWPAVPCSKQSQWFSDGNHKRIAHEVNPQWVRWYAWVREPGEIAAGDPVSIPG